MKEYVPFPVNLPISNAVIFNDKLVMELSGQVGLDPKTDMLGEGIEKQTALALEAIKKILEEANWSLNDIVKSRVFLIDIKDYEKMNEVYARYFTKNFPARFAVVVKELPLGALVEIDCTAAKSE